MRGVMLLVCAALLIGCHSEPGMQSTPVAQPQGEPLPASDYATRGAYEAEVVLPDRYLLEGQGDARPITVSDHHSFAVVLPGELSGRRVFIRAGDFAQEVWLDVEPGGVVGVQP